MKSKEEKYKKDPKTPRLNEQEKRMEINELKSKINYQKDSRQYNVQLTILEEIKKLKINLEITDKNKYKSIYITAITLNELISLNDFFKRFRDYSEAFDYLLKNFTKIDRTKIKYLNNNRDIKIILLFAVNDFLEENNDDIIEEGIELVLHHYNINTNKTLANLASVINTMKESLENCNISIKEIKEDANNDKIEKDKKINELEETFIKKLEQIKNSRGGNNYTNNKEMDSEIQTDFEEKFSEIFAKFEDYDNDIIKLRQNIEDGYAKQKNEINKNNKIFFEKESELSKLIMDKFEDFIDKINNLDEKNIEIENYFNNKISELDTKTNICFNELIKKFNQKGKNDNFSENDLKIKINEIIGKILEDNENIEKNLENKFNQKLEDFKKFMNENIMNKIEILEQKLMNIENINQEENEKKQILLDNNKINDKLNELEEKINNFENNLNIKNQNNDYEEKINGINTLISKQSEEFEKYKKDVQNNFEKNELNINENKININDLNNLIAEMYEKKNKNETPKKEDTTPITDRKNEIDFIKNGLDDTNKTIENKTNEINNKIEEMKKEIYSMIDKINEQKKEDNKETNNKIIAVKNDLLKMIETKNNIIEKKINVLDGKCSSYDNKINKITKDNQVYCDKINNIEKGNKSNNDTSKFKEIDSNLKSFDLKLKNMDFKLKQMDSFKKLGDYSSKTLVTSNSNGNFIRNSNIGLYSYKLTSTDDNEESNLKIKRYSNYNLNNSRTSRIKDRNNIFDLSIDTTILNPEDLNDNFFLFSKLKEIYPYNRYIRFILMYRASRDGDLAKDFHLQCDFIGPNLTFVKTKKGYIFGGFTVKNWKHLYKDIKKDDPENGTQYKDEKAFGFSVNKKKIYENGFIDEEIIYCNNNYGVCFNNYFFKIFDECFKNGGICGKIEESNFVGIDKEYEFTGGEKKFDVEEIEIFQIGFR